MNLQTLIQFVVMAALAAEAAKPGTGLQAALNLFTVLENAVVTTAKAVNPPAAPTYSNSYQAFADLFNPKPGQFTGNAPDYVGPTQDTPTSGAI